jgi:hypothetical protein
MESPKKVNRFLLALLIAFTLAAVACSIYFRDVSILLWWLVVIALFFVVCGLLALFNIIIFVPVFWLIAKLFRKQSTKTDKLP